MNLLIKNKKGFLTNFLTPISRINNSGSCVLNVNTKGISALLSSIDSSLIMYSFYDYPNELVPMKLNMPDLGRFIKILQCIDSDEVDLQVETNCIKYSSKSLRFTYHVLHEGIIAQCPVSVEKIKSIDYQTTFTIPLAKLVEIVKCSPFASETSKIYFTTEEDGVYGELTDQQRANVDAIKLQIASTFKGTPIPNALPLQYEVIRIITTTRCEGVNVLINNAKCVVTFEVANENVKNLYISSGLTG